MSSDGLAKNQKKARFFLIFFLFFLIPNTQAFDMITAKGITTYSIHAQKSTHVISPKTKKTKRKTRKGAEGCQKRNKYNSLIREISARYGVETKLVRAIITVESCFNSNAVSSKGARGLMQLMPNTAKRFGVKNSFDPAQNISGGVKYLRFLLGRYKNKPSLVVAAYNAGEGAVDKYQSVPPYKETQAYVRKVLTMLGTRTLETQANANNSFAKRYSYRKSKSSRCVSSLGKLAYPYMYYSDHSIKTSPLKKHVEVARECDL